ncbi:hypothetical protein ACH4OW_11655 [Streptomyces sp. NPDC017056]|uniref:hypothetical protein n=1 Tax=Streptomyces sp. NPDC017056 TaxID=3364973 RepID=UPI0037B6BFD8
MGRCPRAAFGTAAALLAGATLLLPVLGRWAAGAAALVLAGATVLFAVASAWVHYVRRPG